MWSSKLNPVLESMHENKDKKKKQTSQYSQYSQCSQVVISRDHEYDGKTIKQFKTFSFQDINLLKPRDESTVSSGSHCYEVIPENTRRRFYADLDLPISSSLFSSTSVQDMVDSCINLVKYILITEFKITAKQLKVSSHPIVLTVPNESLKKSAHIIWPNIIFDDVTTTRFFVQVIKHHIHTTNNPLMIEAFDMAVYNRNQSFRLAYNNKIKWRSDMLYALVPVNKDLSITDCLVGIYDKKNVDERLPLYGLNSKAAEFAQCKPLFVSSALLLCNRKPEDKFTHPANFITGVLDSVAVTLLSNIPNSSEQPQSYEVWWGIGQALKNTSDCTNNHLFAWVNWSNLARDRYPNEMDACVDAWKRMTISECGHQLGYLEMLASASASACTHAYHKADPMKELLEVDLVNVDIYNDFRARPYEFKDSKILVHQSAMGSGKTYQIIDLIKKNKDIFRIIIISPRRSFSNEKVAEFRKDAVCEHLVNYQDPIVQNNTNWYTEFPQLAVQVESLHHLDGYPNTYDLVICDEIESILNQFSSSTHKYLRGSFTAFKEIVQQAKKVIMADAFITNRTLAFCKSLNVPFKFEKNEFIPCGHINAHILAVAKSFRQTPTVKSIFIEHIKGSIANHKKLCITTSSISLNKEIVDTLKSIMDEKHIIEYDSTTGDHLVSDLKNVRTTWADPEIKVVIYTGVITVGVSFDVPNVFDNIYVYGTSNCPIARDLLQAHFRVRHIINPNIYIVLNASRRNKPSETLKSIAIFQSSINNNLMTHGLREDERLYAIYKTIAAYNKLEENLGHTRYEDMFLHWTKIIGYNVIRYGDYKLMEEKDKFVQKVTSPASYNKMKQIDNEVIDQYENNVKYGKATALEKESLVAYFFYKHWINSVTCKFDDNSQWEYELFVEYITNHQSKSHVENLVTELTQDAVLVAGAASGFVTFDVKDHAATFKYVMAVCRVLDLKNSFDTNTVFRNEDLERFDRFYNAQSPKQVDATNKLFGINVRAKEFGNRQSITTISSIFKMWNGFTVKAVQTQKSHKSNIKVYECVLERNDVVGEYAKAIMTPAEKYEKEETDLCYLKGYAFSDD